MNCKTVQCNLSAYVDRELTPDEHAEVRAHLSSCNKCGAEESDLRRLKSLLSGISSPEPNPDFEMRLQRTIQNSSRVPRPLEALRFSWLVLVPLSVVCIWLVAESVSVAPLPAKSEPAATLASDVARDQIYESSASSPLFGATVISADYGR